jgi:hypothetical protein
MRRFAFLGAAVALLFSGAVVLAAASPAPSPSPSAKPTATPHPSAAPSATPAPSASSTPAPSASSTPATSGQTFNATVQPLQITGSATVVETSAKTGTVTLRVSGLLDAIRWSVDIDGGTIARPNERVEIASKSGADLTRLATDTVRIHLSAAEMAAFLKAEKSGGVVAVVSDGTRVGYAEFGA